MLGGKVKKNVGFGKGSILARIVLESWAYICEIVPKNS